MITDVLLNLLQGTGSLIINICLLGFWKHLFGYSDDYCWTCETIDTTPMLDLLALAARNLGFFFDLQLFFNLCAAIVGIYVCVLAWKTGEMALRMLFGGR